MLSKNQLTKLQISYSSSAYDSVQAHRSAFSVPVAKKGTIHDYVPFYFNSRSPMLYTIKCGNLQGVRMQDLVFFKSSAQAVANSGSGFAFTDGHGIMALSDYYDDLKDLDQLPWNVINATYWTDFVDGSRLRQSEFLVYEKFDWGLVESIGVYDATMKVKVENLISSYAHKPKVDVQSSWYF